MPVLELVVDVLVEVLVEEVVVVCLETLEEELFVVLTVLLSTRVIIFLEESFNIKLLEELCKKPIAKILTTKIINNNKAIPTIVFSFILNQKPHCEFYLKRFLLF